MLLAALGPHLPEQAAQAPREPSAWAATNHEVQDPEHFHIGTGHSEQSPLVTLGRPLSTSLQLLQLLHFPSPLRDILLLWHIFKLFMIAKTEGFLWTRPASELFTGIRLPDRSVTLGE